MAEKKKKWIAEAIPKSHEGRFRKKAERAGETTREFAKEHDRDSGKTGKQARLAEKLMEMPHKNRAAKLYDHPRSGKD